MSNPVKSLASQLDWREVFAVIGLDYPNRSVLPQSTPCPFCKNGALTVMSDHVLDTQWLHCCVCRFAGDLIEFAARVLDCSIELTVSHLDSHGMFQTPLGDDDLAHYRIQHLDYRKRINAFWDRAKQAPAQSDSIGANGRLLLRKCRLNDFVYQDEWKNRGGQLFGVARREEIENLFAPKSFEIQERSNHRDRTSRRRGGGPGSRRLFHGREWDEVLVIAHSDLPERIIGFSFMGGDVDQPQLVFKRVNVGCCVARPRESGFGFMEAINGIPHPVFGRHVFVFLDAEAATILHARHLRESYRPLPILLAKSTRDYFPVALLPDLEECRLIFCGPLSETLPLAKAHNAMVATYSIPELDIANNLKHRTSSTFLSLFQRSAVPWVEGLRQLLATSSKAQGEVLVRSLQLSPRESEALQRGLGGSAGERFAELTPHRLGGNQVPLGAFTVEETPDGWIARKPGTEVVICNRPLRIESIYKSASGDVAYGVVVHLPSQNYKFIALEGDIKECSLFQVVADQLRDQSHEHLAFAQHKWAKHSLSLALGFSEPQVIPYADRVGWNPARLRFQFPQFAILSTGDIDSTPMPIVEHDNRPPASELTPPARARQAAVMLSRLAPDAQLIWTLAACVAHNLLAGNCTREPIGVVLDGLSAQETGTKAARALGCGRIDSQNRGSRSILRFISPLCGAHDFPSVVDLGLQSRTEVTTDWIDDPHLRRAIVPLPFHAAIAVSLHQSFVRIRAHEFPFALGPLESAAGWIIPSYLEDLCRRRKLIDFQTSKSEVLAVLYDMANWFERCGGNPKAILAGEQLLAIDSLTPAIAFVELVERMRSKNDIACVVRGETNTAHPKKPIAVIEPSARGSQADVVQISPRVVNEVLRRKRVLALRTDDVRVDLEFHSALRGTVDDDEGTSWLIDAGWWNQEKTTIRRKLRLLSSSNCATALIDGPTEQENQVERCPVFSD